MSYADTILPEFDQEMASTRKVLEQVPHELLDWKAHPKLNTIGWNANHLADIIGWFKTVLKQNAFDVAPVDGEPYRPLQLSSKQEILDTFDRNVAAARQAIESISDEETKANWSLLQGGQPLLTMPRSAVVRTFVLNHVIHHRAHLCVYLRMNGIPVPGMYGPSGDEAGT